MPDIKVKTYKGIVYVCTVARNTSDNGTKKVNFPKVRSTNSSSAEGFMLLTMKPVLVPKGRDNPEDCDN